MIRIENVESKDEKTKVTLEIMNALPEWFSPPEDIQRKAMHHREYPFLAVYDDEKVIGFAAIKIHKTRPSHTWCDGL